MAARPWWLPLWKRVQVLLYPSDVSNGQTWVGRAKQNPPVNGTQPKPAHIPEQFITTIHGKQFVQYAGLLALAHERGLTSLVSHFIDVNAELALAEATAEFNDGRMFSECADATPGNVNQKVRAHFPSGSRYLGGQGEAEPAG